MYAKKRIDRERFDIFIYFLYHKPDVSIRRFHICYDNRLKFARLSGDSLEIYIEKVEKIICADANGDADRLVNQLFANSDILICENDDFADTMLNDDLNGNPPSGIFSGGIGSEEEPNVNSGNDEDDVDNLSNWEREMNNDSIS